MGVEVTKEDRENKPYDPLEVRNKDPNYEYRWARKTDINLRKKEYQGYEFVNATTNKGEKISEDPRTGVIKVPDGSRHIGDTVLMRVSKAVYDGRRRESVDKAQRRLEAAKHEYLDKHRGTGAYEDHKDNKGMTTYREES